MKILVTGSSGYLGSSFINQYKERYNFSSFSLLKNAIEEIDFNGINTILHCAALVHQKNEHDYNKYYETNVEYPMKLANRAKKEGIEHFIFISTVAVYGDDLTLIDENSKTNPVSPYGRSKLLAEQKLSQLQDETFQVSIIRIPMIYGMDAPGNISSLIRVIKKVPILPLANINNKRSFIYIDNLLNIIDKIITDKTKGTFLVADKTPISTSKLIKILAKGLDKKIILIQIPLFSTLLRRLKPQMYAKLYDNLEIKNSRNIKIANFTPA